MIYFPDPQDNLWNLEVETSIGYLHGLTLDIGTGRRTPFPWIITLDNKNLEAHIKSSGDKLPFKDEHFDNIFACHILEHFEDILGTLKEWIRVTKKFGFIVIICPDARHTPNIGNYNCDPQHRHDLTFDILKEIILLFDNIVIVNKNTVALQNWSFQMVLKKIK